ncbi:MAG TPA: hypothetical protein VLE49_17065 [Anaerolineales bacterium]|nr:hypothetical protein [Anaerolineales bacterium]
MKLTGPQATIIAAMIAVFGIAIGSFLNPLAEKVINRPTPTLDPASLAIEQIPQDIFAYGGNNNPDGGNGVFVLIDDQENVPNYKLDYSLPGDKYGYAGLAFNFHESMNLSAYSAIECIITFSQPGNQIDLYVKDIGNNFNTIRVVNNVANEMTLRHEFKNFPNINFNAVKEIGLVASTDIAVGTYQVVVKNIRFAK